jgi:hypothetical protein
MERIKEIKAEIRHSEWAEQIQECQNSGMTVTRWCQENNIRASTYYKRVKIVQEELLAGNTKLQSIVPVSISSEIALQKPSSQFEKTNSENPVSKPEKIVIRKSGIEIEIPQNADENAVLALLKGLSQC